jgi:hypothetical protein
VKPIIYVAAPVTGDPIGNAQRAIRWVKWFVLRDPSRVYVAPWVAEVLGFANEPLEPEFYQRVLDDDCEVISALHGLVGVAGKWSCGMLQERATARARNEPVLDMTKYLEPTDVPDDFSLVVAWEKVTPHSAMYVEPY